MESKQQSQSFCEPAYGVADELHRLLSQRFVQSSPALTAISTPTPQIPSSSQGLAMHNAIHDVGVVVQVHKSVRAGAAMVADTDQGVVAEEVAAPMPMDMGRANMGLTDPATANHEPTVFWVQVGGQTFGCHKAASCLLQPQVGDTVLISGPSLEQLYLIAVLHQTQPSQALIEVPGELALKASAVQLQSDTSLSLEAATLNVEASQSKVVIEEADYIGKSLRATVTLTRLVGKVYEVIVDRLAQMSRNATRITEQREQLRAGSIDYEADQSARVHANYTMVTAKSLVKVDSDQIHMG